MVLVGCASARGLASSPGGLGDGNLADALTGASRLALVRPGPQINGHSANGHDLDGFEYSGPCDEVAERCGGKVTTTPSGYANCDCPNCGSVTHPGVNIGASVAVADRPDTDHVLVGLRPPALPGGDELGRKL